MSLGPFTALIEELSAHWQLLFVAGAPLLLTVRAGNFVDESMRRIRAGKWAERRHPNSYTRSDRSTTPLRTLATEAERRVTGRVYGDKLTLAALVGHLGLAWLPPGYEAYHLPAELQFGTWGSAGLMLMVWLYQLKLMWDLARDHRAAGVTRPLAINVIGFASALLLCFVIIRGLTTLDGR